MTIYAKRLTDTAKLPKRTTPGSAGYDIFSDDEDFVLNPGETKIVSTGIAIENNDIRSEIMIYPRSGLACKHNITLANCVGIVDSDYRGEIKVALINQGKESFTIEKSMRIAQLVIQPIKLPVIREVEDIKETTKRNDKGFGSTGLK